MDGRDLRLVDLLINLRALDVNNNVSFHAVPAAVPYESGMCQQPFTVFS